VYNCNGNYMERVLTDQRHDGWFARIAPGVGVWAQANGKWQMANGKWRMANGEWQMGGAGLHRLHRLHLLWLSWGAKNVPTTPTGAHDRPPWLLPRGCYADATQQLRSRRRFVWYASTLELARVLAVCC
jgi:hypothetical protein